MTPDQCATVLAVMAQDNDMGEYVRDVLHQSAAYLTELQIVIDQLDKATEQINRTMVVVDNATSEIQRLNLELTYARSRG